MKSFTYEENVWHQPKVHSCIFGKLTNVGIGNDLEFFEKFDKSSLGEWLIEEDFKEAFEQFKKKSSMMNGETNVRWIFANTKFS